jgi:hypothetical protein
MEAGEGFSFDVLAFVDGKSVRIQTKSTQYRDGGSFKFITARGRYANKNSHAVSLTHYTQDDIDIIACAALPIDKVLFVPVTQAAKTLIRYPESAFTTADAAQTTFEAALKELKLP